VSAVRTARLLVRPPRKRTELLAIIAPENLASQNVGRKLGFTFWKQAKVDGDLRNLSTLSI
jgi:RimJ/RimL family protein N-acetyltransferase